MNQYIEIIVLILFVICLIRYSKKQYSKPIEKKNKKQKFKMPNKHEIKKLRKKNNKLHKSFIKKSLKGNTYRYINNVWEEVDNPKYNFDIKEIDS